MKLNFAKRMSYIKASEIREILKEGFWDKFLESPGRF